jgi:uncharacterized protein with PIN domain
MIGPFIYTLSIGGIIIIIYYLFKSLDEMFNEIEMNRIYIYDSKYTCKNEIDNISDTISEVDTIILSSSESDLESDSNNEIQSIKMKTDYVSENDFILLT